MDKNLNKQLRNCLIWKTKKEPVSTTCWPWAVGDIKASEGTDYFLKHCGWARATPTCSHTHLEISQLGQPPSAKPPLQKPHHLSDAICVFQNIWSSSSHGAPPTAHPPLASKHPTINTTSLNLRVNSPEGKGHTGSCSEGINRYQKKNGAWDSERKFSSAKISPNCSKLFPFVCSHMLGDDCQTWKSLVVLIERWHV